MVARIEGIGNVSWSLLGAEHHQAVNFVERLAIADAPFDAARKTEIDSSPDGLIYLAGYTAVLSDNGSVDFFGFDPATGAWLTLPLPPILTLGSGLAVGADGKIYLVGVEAAAYDPVTQTWAQLLSPFENGSWPIVAADTHGDIIDLGGDTYPSPGAELFNVSTGQWQMLPQMPVGSSAGAIAPGCDGRIYVFGGDLYDVSNLVQVLDPADGGSWLLSP